MVKDGAIEVPVARAYISYSRDDSEFALRLAADLEQQGATVCTERSNAEPEQSWDQAIEQALKNCSHLLVVLSPSSVRSEQVLAEAEYALKENKAVIPILYRDCGIPFWLSRLKHVDFRTDYDSGLRILLRVFSYSDEERHAKREAEQSDNAAPPVSSDAPPAPSAPGPTVVTPSPAKGVGGATAAARSGEEPEPNVSLAEAYERIRNWYTRNIAKVKDGANSAGASLIEALPERASELEMRAVMAEVIAGALKWGYAGSDGNYTMSRYAHAAVEPYGGYSLDDKEQAALHNTSKLWPYLSYRGRRQAPEPPPAEPKPVPRPSEPLPKLDVPPTAKVVSDRWVTTDTLGYEAYVRALASLITHPNTKPPLTIGIEAPWGAGKTSVMKMIQHALDARAHLTEESKAGRRNRATESRISISQILEMLKKPEFDTRVKPTQSRMGRQYGIPGRVTVWFNAWKYQSSEQVWAGLAHCIISHVTVRMTPRQRELFWLKLNSRRVDVNAIRRKVYETILQDLLPRVIAWGTGLLLLVVGLGIFAMLHGTGLYPTFAKILHWTSPLVAVAAGLDLWRKWTGAVNNELQERAKGDLLKLVREPDYEGKMGFLYLVESDVREVLDLVATEQMPMVIFIDDLDRCVPHKVAEIVEAISLFLAGDYPNCIFVLGMEPHVVAAALEVANSDLIKRMTELGLSDTSAPMGWRFMEKIVQLPLVLPPPTTVGLSSYMSTLAPDPEKTKVDDAAIPAPDERQVKRFAQTLGAEDTNVTLSQVVAKTEQLLSGESKAEATAIVEASKQVFFRKFDHDDPLVRKFLDEAVRTFGANPRQIKRYINLFRLCCNVRHSIWLDATAAGKAADLPSDAEVTKYVTLSVQWPQATSLLRRAATSTDGSVSSLLKMLEQKAIECETQPHTPQHDAEWAALLQQLSLLQGQGPATSTWVANPAFRSYLARGSSLAGAADKGLW